MIQKVTSKYTLTSLDAAWLAGLLEGCGWIDIRKTKQQVRPELRLIWGSLDAKLINRLCDLLKVRRYKWKGKYGTRLASFHARAIATQLLPHIRGYKGDVLHEYLMQWD